MQGSSCVLLDANIVIEAHARKVWTSMISRVTLVIPSIIQREAAFYIDPNTEQQVRIDLASSLQEGTIRSAEADAGQLARFYARFDRVFIERMDAGEAEALALLMDGALPEYRFCTSDGPAIRALSLLQMPEVGVSLETLLHQIGFTRKLVRPFTEGFFREQLDRGAREFVMGQGLRPTQVSLPPEKSVKRKKRR